MSWKTQKEEGALGRCGRGVTRACSRSGSTFAPCPSAACGASLPQHSIPLCGDGATLSLDKGRAAGDRRLMGGSGKQDEAGELESVFH